MSTHCDLHARDTSHQQHPPGVVACTNQRIPATKRRQPLRSIWTAPRHARILKTKGLLHPAVMSEMWADDLLASLASCLALACASTCLCECTEESAVTEFAGHPIFTAPCFDGSAPQHSLYKL